MRTKDQNRRYSDCQDSGFPWIGNIPVHWKVKRLKFLTSRIYTGSTPSSNGPDYFTDGEINWFTPGDFNGEVDLISAAKKLTKNVFIETNQPKYLPNSILLVGIGATLGKVGVCSDICSSNQQINAILPSEKYNSKFVAYFLQAQQEVIKVLANATTLGILNQEKTKNIHVPHPEINEQEEIANWLDQKTTHIDNLIQQKQLLLELLTEKRTSLITQAVTKGLDPKAKLKDSGIEWLGEVPEHWKIKRLKFTVRLINQKIENKEVDLPYMGLEHIESWTGKRIEDENAGSEGVSNMFKAGDVLFGKLRPYLAKVYLSDIEGICTSEALVLRTQPILVPRFLQLYLLTDRIIDVVDSSYPSGEPRPA